MKQDVECACYASYFAEFAEYFGREGLEAREMLRLLYQSFRALLKPALPNKLVQRIFELKIMVINGEYTEDPPARRRLRTLRLAVRHLRADREVIYISSERRCICTICGECGAE